MSLYPIALFLHVSGAIGYFVAMGTWLISLVLLAPLGTALLETRRRVIERLARTAPDGQLPEELERCIRDPVLLAAPQTLTALLLGVVFLMTTKPSLVGSIIVMAIALVLGLVWGALVSRRRHRGQDMAES